MRKIALRFPAMANETRNFSCQRLPHHNGPFAAITRINCAIVAFTLIKRIYDVCR
jgi:hypothetical protein